MNVMKDFNKSREIALAEIIRLVNEDDGVDYVAVENKQTNKKERNYE